MGISIQYILRSLVLIFYPNGVGGGGGVKIILEKQTLGGGGKQKCVVLAADPVGGRSRATELPCF